MDIAKNMIIFMLPSIGLSLTWFLFRKYFYSKLEITIYCVFLLISAGIVFFSSVSTMITFTTNDCCVYMPIYQSAISSIAQVAIIVISVSFVRALNKSVQPTASAAAD